MPAVGRLCSECSNSLAGKSPLARTCSNACRLRRSRRIARANRNVQEFADQNNAASQEVAAIVRREAPDVITRVLSTELKPVVREALTEDVLRAVNEMVGLTPAAVAALQEDLASENETIRQRAYTLVIKYTVGHPALVKDDSSGQGQMVVNFSLPRPDPEATIVTPADVEEELKYCDLCETEKPASEFVAGSARCKTCFDEWSAKIREQFA